jgi:hypothetical protein
MIVKNTISTMFTAGQITYLRQAGLGDAGLAILVEVHYYRNRFQATPILHKDTKGQTLFVNLNYVNDKEIAGPEYILNPPAFPGHELQIAGSLPDKFLDHLAKAKNRLGAPTKIGSSVIPAHGVVSFVDELIHHATPLLRSRTTPISSSKLAEYLQRKFPVEFKQAVAASDAYLKSGYTSAISASAASWIASWFSSSVIESRKWYVWIQMTKSNRTFDKLALQLSGFTATQLDEMLEMDEAYNRGFLHASIPSTTGGGSFLAPTPQLKRQMSSELLRAERFKKQQQVPEGEQPPPRRFFRTWVRAVPRAQLL